MPADEFGHRSPYTALAFSPGYPLLVRLLTQLPGASLVEISQLAATYLVTDGPVGRHVESCGRVGDRKVGLMTRSCRPAAARRGALCSSFFRPRQHPGPRSTGGFP